jgi:hypothetical protein
MIVHVCVQLHFIHACSAVEFAEKELSRSRQAILVMHGSCCTLLPIMQVLHSFVLERRLWRLLALAFPMKPYSLQQACI